MTGKSAPFSTRINTGQLVPMEKENNIIFCDSAALYFNYIIHRNKLELKAKVLSPRLSG